MPNLGAWHWENGQLKKAIARYGEVLRIWRELGAWTKAGETLHALAKVYATRGEWEQAAAAWERIQGTGPVASGEGGEDA
jgi:tetratricopeptide (TPR) repeat protein